MKLKFFHDVNIIYSKKDNNYFSGGFHYSIWERYLKVFELLDVHTRLKYEENISEGFKLSSGRNVNILPISSYKNFRSLINISSINKDIEAFISDNDGYLLRLPSVIGFITGMKLIHKNKKYFVEVVGSGFDSFYYKGGFMGKLISFPAYYLQKKIIKNASVVTYITESYLQNKFPTKGIQFNGIANIHFDFSLRNEISPDQIKEIVEKKPSHHYKIGLIGSLNVDYKGHLIALKALKELLDRNVNVTLYFVGQGNIKKFDKFISKYHLEGNVVHLGMLSAGQEIQEFLNEIDIYIQPSKTEGHGRALVEAVYSGAVSFGSNVGGIPDTLLKEYLFDPNNYKSLANLIETAIYDKNYATKNIISNFNNIKKYQTDLIESNREKALRKYRKILEESQ